MNHFKYNNKNFITIILINILVLTSLSMVHPVTPKLINSVGLPTFYFGLLYGCLNISTFVASPTFGSICDLYGKKFPMMLGMLGYTIGQVIFGFFPNHVTVLIARIISGIFISGYYVSSISYVSYITPNSQKLKRFAYLNASGSLGIAIGSFLGGYLGTNDYRVTFIVQIILSLISLLCIAIFFKDISIKNKEAKFTIKIFSIKDFKKVSKTNKFIFLILSLMILTFLGIQSYTSTISYYVEDILKLPTTVNGLILGSTGMFTLITNLFIIPIANKKLSSKTLYLSSTLISGLSIVISMTSTNKIILTTFLLIFIIAHTLIAPIMQSMIIENSKNNQGELLGLQNGFKAIGSFLGAISSGIIFDLWFKLPFLISGFSLILCFIILVLYENLYNKQSYNQ